MDIRSSHLSAAVSIADQRAPTRSTDQCASTRSTDHRVATRGTTRRSRIPIRQTPAPAVIPAEDEFIESSTEVQPAQPVSQPDPSTSSADARSRTSSSANVTTGHDLMSQIDEQQHPVPTEAAPVRSVRVVQPARRATPARGASPARRHVRQPDRPAPPPAEYWSRAPPTPRVTADPSVMTQIDEIQAAEYRRWRLEAETGAGRRDRRNHRRLSEPAQTRSPRTRRQPLPGARRLPLTARRLQTGRQHVIIPPARHVMVTRQGSSLRPDVRRQPAGCCQPVVCCQPAVYHPPGHASPVPCASPAGNASPVCRAPPAGNASPTPVSCAGTRRSDNSASLSLTPLLSAAARAVQCAHEQEV